MNPEVKDISVIRVANGWVLHARRMDRFESVGGTDTMVARTPGELAQILTDWAGKQQESAK